MLPPGPGRRTEGVGGRGQDEGESRRLPPADRRGRLPLRLRRRAGLRRQGHRFGGKVGIAGYELLTNKNSLGFSTEAGGEDPSFAA